MFRLETSHLQASTILCQMLLPVIVLSAYNFLGNRHGEGRTRVGGSE